MALQPDYLQGLPAELEKLTEQLEKELIEDISRRIAKAGEITDTAAYQLLRLKELGASSDYLEKLIADYTQLSGQQVRQMIFDAAQVDSEFYEGFYRRIGQPYIPYEYNDYLQQLTKAAVNQTCGELKNYTRSMGFSVRGADGRMQFKPAAKAYQSAMDKAFMLAASGGVDYITAVRRATAEITGSGLMFVDYASGVRTHADVAARRALLTGISQMTGQIAESNAAKLGTDVVEVTAHAGARPDHAAWQGKWFSLNGLDKRYPKLRDVTGYGTVTGLKGANCRHDFYPVIPGIDEPAYTAEQLANIDPPPVTIGGKTYTYYEAEQRQRYMERSMRKTKREIIAADASGDKDRMTEKSVLLRRQREEYKEFSEKAGLLTRNERTQVGGYGRSISAKASAAGRKNTVRNITPKPLDNGGKSGIMKSIQQSDLGVLKQKLRSDDRVSKEYYSVIKNKFSKGSDAAKKAFNKFVPLDSVEDAYYEGVAHYNTRTKKIRMHYNADLKNPRGKAVTWFHEHGHMVDDLSGNISNDKEFLELLRSDAFAYRMKISKEQNLKTFDKIDHFISSKLNNARKHSAVSDIFEGITEGNIVGIAGRHGMDYWKRDDTLITSEAFAHMFEAQFDSVRYAEMKKYFPNALKYMEKKLEVIAQ